LFPLFATGVVDAGGVKHLDLQISPRIFEKIRNALMLFSGTWGKMIHEKTLSKKSLDTVPLMATLYLLEGIGSFSTLLCTLQYSRF
jgi:hypothetical protein